MSYRLSLLGGAAIEGEEGFLGGRVARRHPLALLALLATAPFHTLSRDRAIGLLWPELADRRARARLRTTLHLVRKALGSEAILSVGDDLRLDPELVTTGRPGWGICAARGSWTPRSCSPSSRRWRPSRGP